MKVKVVFPGIGILLTKNIGTFFLEGKKKTLPAFSKNILNPINASFVCRRNYNSFCTALQCHLAQPTSSTERT